MTQGKIISAQDFINKAIKVVEIDGFEAGEKFTVKLKPVSLLAMMTKGKLPNELKAQVASLFSNSQNNPNEQVPITSIEELALMQELMNKVCEECMLEPKFSEIGEYMTDAQKTQIFTYAQGNVKQYTPSNQE